MKKYILFIYALLLMNTTSIYAQELPYREVPEYPSEYNAGTVVARLIDGLGFRFYWATDSLRAEDLAYKPSDEARTSEETIDHIYSMSRMVRFSARGEVNTPSDVESLSFEEKRKHTLLNLQEASDILRNNSHLEEMDIVFEGKEGNNRSFPFWYQLNGPIADCIWHVGQIVSFRRSSGNPISSKPSFFSGKVK